MKIATAMIEGSSTKKAITISVRCQLGLRLLWVGEAARPRSPETETVLCAKSCISCCRDQRRLRGGDIAAGKHIVERQVIVEQEALLGRRAMLQASDQCVTHPIFHSQQ